MHTYVRTLQKVASRIAPSRILSFEMVHVLKTLQLIQEKGHVSRHTLCKKLDLGEGTVKTLVKHLKIYDLVVTDKSGTRISTKGSKLLSELVLSMPAEMSISTCSVALGKFNYGILLRQMSLRNQDRNRTKRCSDKNERTWCHHTGLQRQEIHNPKHQF